MRFNILVKEEGTSAAPTPAFAEADLRQSGSLNPPSSPQELSLHCAEVANKDLAKAIRTEEVAIIELES